MLTIEERLNRKGYYLAEITADGTKIFKPVEKEQEVKKQDK